MERITPAEWRRIAVALENQRLVVGKDIQLHRDHDRWDELEKTLREFKALDALMVKVAQRTRGTH